MNIHICIYIPLIYIYIYMLMRFMSVADRQTKILSSEKQTGTAEMDLCAVVCHLHTHKDAFYKFDYMHLLAENDL